MKIGASADRVEANRAGGGGRWRIALLLAVVLALRIPGATGELVDHDSWRQTETATIARNFLDDPRILWPRVNWGAPGPGYVEAEFQLFSYATSLLYRVFGHDPWLGRLLSILITGATAVVLMRLASGLIGPRAGVVAALLFLCAPLVFRYSRAFMPEATVLLFYVLALERYLRFLDDRRWSTVLTAALAMALAILVKPTAIHLGLVLIWVQVARDGWGSLFRARPIAFAVVALVPATLYYAHAAELHAVYGNTFGVISGGDSKWGRPEELVRPEFHLGLWRMDIAGTLRLLGLPFAIAGLWFAAGQPLRRLAVAFLVVLWLYYCIVGRYAGFAPRGLHYHVYAAVPWSLLGAAGVAAVSTRCGRRTTWCLIGLTALLCAYQVWGSRWLWTERHDLFLRAGQAVAALSAPDDVVIVLSHDAATDGSVPNNFEQPDVLFHAWRRGRILPRDRQDGDALERVAGPDARWFVNFPGLNAEAAPSFLTTLERLGAKVAEGDGFEVYRLDT